MQDLRDLKCNSCSGHILNVYDHRKCVTCTTGLPDRIARLNLEYQGAIQKVKKLEADCKVYEENRKMVEAQGRKVLQSGAWSDVITRVDGHDIPAHKCILTAK